MTTDNFDTGVPRADFWAQISGGAVQTLFADRVQSLVFGNAAGSRLAQTLAFDTRSLKTLEFDLIYGDGTNGGEAIDGNNDLVQLEYSTNSGASWQLLQAYTAPIAWSRFKINLPALAQSANTLLRWRQPANDGAGKDFWALDNIELKNTSFTPPASVDFSAGLSDGFWLDLAGAKVTNTFAGRTASLFFGSTGGARYAQTVALDTTLYKSLGFDLIYGNGTNGGDAIEGNGDQVKLEYSTNNGLSWQQIQNYSSPATWTRYIVNLPLAAQSTNTLLRWAQPLNDGAGKDAWALDNISLVSNTSLISLTPLSASVSEGNSGPTPYTFTITRSGDTSGVSTLTWSVSVPANSLNPSSTSDFTIEALPFGTVAFAAGEASKTITFTIDGDTEVEAHETFLLRLLGPTGGVLNPAASSVVGTILNDDSSLDIAPLSANKLEANSGRTPFTFTVSRTGNTTVVSSAAWSVVARSGITPADFADGILPSGTVSFAVGETSKTISVDVAGDTAIENDESFRLTLKAPSVGTTLGTATATATILNDDTSISITDTAVTRSEGLSGATLFPFTILRRGNTSGISTVSWSVAGSGANPTAGSDFIGSTSGTLTFSPGQASQVLVVNVNGDSVQEADETFTLTLSAPSGAYLDRASAIGTIRNDDRIGDVNANRIIGTTQHEFIDGGPNADTITGGGGADVFAFRFTQSRFTAPDVITDFAVGTDKIDLFTSNGLALPTPVSFSRAADNANASTLDDLSFSVFADANGALPGNQTLRANNAVVVRSTNAAIAGTYLFINNASDSRSPTDDLLIRLDRVIGALPAIGGATASTWFV